jgi:hypothetical protein
MSPGAIVKAAVLQATARSLRADSLALKVRAQEVRGAHRIHGSSDGRRIDDSTLTGLIISIIVERPLCLSCIATKASARQLEALRCIERIQATLRVVMEPGERCRACGSTIGPVYSLPRPD